MLTKRLLHQWSFLVLLCLIPVSVVLTNAAMSQKSGIFHVAICNEGTDEQAKKIVDSIMKDDGVITFTQCESSEYAEKLVQIGKVDAAWIFPQDFSKNMISLTSNASNTPFLQIIEREESIMTVIAREKLFGAIYQDYSRAIYEGFSYKKIVSKDKVSQKTVRAYYDKLKRRGNVLRIEKLDAAENKQSKVNYLTAPIRGILSLMVVLCTLAAAMYFLREQAAGKFDWLSPRKRIVPAIASCISAALLSGIAVLGAIQLSGISVGFFRELISMALLILSATGFCTILSVIMRSSGKLGAMLPGLIIVMLVLSPIFFNFKILRTIRLMIPTHYYLYSVYNYKYYLYAIFYCLAIYSIGLIINYFYAERKYNRSVMGL